MIYGNVNNAMFEKQAAVLPAPLSAALHFLKETDLASHEAGVFNIELGGGPEDAGYYSDDGTSEVDEDLLDTPRDILFYKNNADAREGRIPMTIGTYAMYFPWDVHIPAIQTGNASSPIRKIVIKVPLEACMKGE